MNKESYMRLYYPYCMKKLPNGKFVFLNRDYFPIGTLRKDRLSEKDYIDLLMAQTQFSYPISHYPSDYFEDTRQGKEILYASFNSCIHFYLDHLQPWTSKKHHELYEEKIMSLDPVPYYFSWNFDWYKDRRGY